MTLTLALAQFNTTVGDLDGAIARAFSGWQEAKAGQADAIVFPEGYLTGYFIGDLALDRAFQQRVDQALRKLALMTEQGPAILIGALRQIDGEARGRNSLFFLEGGRVITWRDKVELANDGVYDEVRVYSPGALPGPLAFKGYRLGLPICEDIWKSQTVECLAETGAEVILAVNGSVFSPAKGDERLAQASARVAESGLPLIYLNLVGGQDEVVFDGASFAINRDYRLALQLPAFRETLAFIRLERDESGLVHLSGDRIVPEQDQSGLLYQGAVLALRDYVRKSGFTKVLLGLSGGIDSALVAAMATDALGSKAVQSFMLAYNYTSKASLDDAEACAGRLGIDYECLPIAAPVEACEALLDSYLKEGGGALARENLQSRIRGTLLMTLSNATGRLLLSTGNKSEMATGYATLYGDMNGAFNPLKDLYKTKVFALARWRDQLAQPEAFGFLGPAGTVIGDALINKAPSAELRADQKDEDSLPPYERLDALLAGLIEGRKSPEELIAAGFDSDDVKKVTALFYRSEFKRFQAPPGPKLSERQFGLERRYPIINRFR